MSIDLRVLTLDDVVQAGNAVVGSSPEGKRNPETRYTAPCLVGAILTKLEVDLEPFRLDDNLDTAEMHAVDWEGYFGIRLEVGAYRVLEMAQNEADGHRSWQGAWASANRFLELSDSDN